MKKIFPVFPVLALLCRMVTLIIIACLLAGSLAAGSAESPSIKQPSRRASLTPAEQKEWNKARLQALQDPAVQSTRRITRMALHKAMLQANPSIETIFANMNAHAPKNAISLPHEKKSSGVNFKEWLNNYPPESRAALTPADLKVLEAAHQQALNDPSVRAARKTARITFYNAVMNADPQLGPILVKLGIKTPRSIASPITTTSHLGSEERILGGNVDTWDTDVLVPVVEKSSASAPGTQD